MSPCARLAAVAFAAAVAAQSAAADADLQRVRDLVRAGALPRQALAEAEAQSLARGYRETLRRTLLSGSLDPAEVRAMLDAAKGQLKLVQERFDRVLARVEAGVVPANRLPAARDELDAARRQLELAESRADLVRQMARMEAAQSYREELEAQQEAVYRFEGFSAYEQELLSDIDAMYHQAFGSSPPVSAEGSTALHRAMGLDHTGRIDVALHPDSEEGQFLVYLLESLGIPYIAFRTAIPGQSTAPHIHVGPPSDRLDDLAQEPGFD